MKIPPIILIIALSLITALVTVRYIFPQNGNNGTQSAAHETAFQRVMRTGVLRCGYYVFPPVTIRDPNTRKLSGLSVDMMQHIAEASSLKIEWTEEVDFGNWMPGLKVGRFDAICTPMWPDTSLAREVIFTRPMFYSGINVYARGDDPRFDHNLDAINSPDITIAVIEGNATAYTAHNTFPKAKTLELPQNSPAGLMAESVVTRKADVLLWDENGVHDFLKSNPNAIHNADPSHPIKVMPFELLVNQDDNRLRDFLDVGLQNLEDTGYTGQLLTKWERNPGNFYRLSKSYVIGPK